MFSKQFLMNFYFKTINSYDIYLIWKKKKQLLFIIFCTEKVDFPKYQHLCRLISNKQE